MAYEGHCKWGVDFARVETLDVECTWQGYEAKHLFMLYGHKDDERSFRGREIQTAESLVHAAITRWLAEDWRRRIDKTAGER